VVFAEFFGIDGRHLRLAAGVKHRRPG